MELDPIPKHADEGVDISSVGNGRPGSRVSVTTSFGMDLDSTPFSPPTGASDTASVQDLVQIDEV